MELQIQSAVLEDYIEEIPGIIDFSSPFIYVNRIEIEKRTADPIKKQNWLFCLYEILFSILLIKK